MEKCAPALQACLSSPSAGQRGWRVLCCFLSPGVPRARGSGTLEACTPPLALPRPLRDAGERWLVNDKRATRLVAPEGRGTDSLTHLLKCSPSPSQTLEPQLLPGPQNAFLGCGSHPLRSSPGWNTLAPGVLSLCNLKHSLCVHVCKHPYTGEAQTCDPFPLHP